jgi:hypothetical protein
MVLTAGELSLHAYFLPFLLDVGCSWLFLVLRLSFNSSRSLRAGRCLGRIEER